MGRYSFDKNSLDIIDTEEKAYWIGFIWCDGYNAIRNRNNIVTYEFKLSLKSDDEDHILKFKNFLKSNHPIKKYKTSGFGVDSEEARLLIANTEFGGKLDLIYGLIPNRFDSSKLINSIPDKLIKHFIRGVIDADGSIIYSLVNDKGRISYKATVCISTYESIIEFLNEYLDNEKIVNCKSKIYTRHEGRDGYCRIVKYCGNLNVVNLLNWLYDGATVYLDRKHDKYIEILKHRKLI